MKLSDQTILSFVLFLGLMWSVSGAAQLRVGVGLVTGYDAFHQLKNAPTDTLPASTSTCISSGFSLGPKLWIGSKGWSFAVEGAFGVAPLAFDLQDYVGLGSIYAPVKASLAFGGISGAADAEGFGWAIAGGFQINQTDLYAVTEAYENFSRPSFTAIFGEVRAGLGFEGRSIQALVRIGSGSDDTSVIHVGLVAEVNGSARRRIRKRKDTGI